MSNKQNQKTEKPTKISDEELAVIDDKITEIDLDLTALHNKHDFAVDFITDWSLENLSLEDYDILLKHLTANRHLHTELEE